MCKMKMVDDTPLRSDYDYDGLIVYEVFNMDDVLIALFFKEGLAMHYCRNYPYYYKRMELFFDAIDSFEVE